MQKKISGLFCLVYICTIITLSSCSKKNTDSLFQSPQQVADTIKTTYTLQGSSNSNKLQIIRPGDQLVIQNLQVKALIAGEAPSTGNNGTTNAFSGYRVDPEGFVALPVLGRVKLSNLTRIEAERFLEAKYKENLLNDPIITIDIINAKVTLLGEFQRQGNFNLVKEGTNLIELIGEAGGFNNRANKRRIKIIRGNVDNPEVILVNLENINSLADKKLVMQNNDIVYAETKKIYDRTDKLTVVSPVIQTILIVVNTAIIIYSITR